MKEELKQKIHEFAVNAEVLYKAGYEDGYNAGYKSGYEDGESSQVMTKNGCEYHYQRGLNDAWEYVRKIVLADKDGGFSIGEQSKIFGCISDYEIIKKYSVSEFIAKIKEHEEKTKNEPQEKSQIGKSCMNCKYHVIDYFPNPNFPCSLIRIGLSCTNLSAWESNVTEKLYSNEGKQADDEIKVGDVVTVDNVVEEKTAIVTCAKGSFAFILFNDGETACVNVSEIHKTGGNCPVVTMESLRYTQEKMQEEEHEYERRTDV